MLNTCIWYRSTAPYTNTVHCPQMSESQKEGLLSKNHYVTRWHLYNNCFEIHNIQKTFSTNLGHKMQQTSLPHLMIRNSQGRHSAVQAENSSHYKDVTHRKNTYGIRFQFKII